MQRRTLHRVLLLIALGLSAAVLYRLVSGTTQGEMIHTVFRTTPERGGGFVVLLGLAMFFPAFAALVMVALTWSRPADQTAGFIRSFAATSGLLHAGATWLGPEAPTRWLWASAAAFIAVAITVPPARTSDLPPPALEDRRHQVLGWLLAVASLANAGWMAMQMLGNETLSDFWSRQDSKFLMATLTFPPIVAAIILANRSIPTAPQRAQWRIGARLLCVGAAGLLAWGLVRGWGLSPWAPALLALLFVVVAALPWKEPISAGR